MTAQTLALTDFLLARIAEDEAWSTPKTARRMIGRKIVEVPIDRVPSYVARDNERWQAECEAKRRIMEEHAGTWVTPEDWWACSRCGTAGEYDVDWPCPTLRILAQPYADHPDYRQEWRP